MVEWLSFFHSSGLIQSSMHFLYLLPPGDKCQKDKPTQASFGTHTHTYRQSRVPTFLDMHVSGLWEEVGVPRENPQRHQGDDTNSTLEGLQIEPMPFLLLGDSANH